ncbi:hypothetical protein BHU72_10015 [Desulfuribacillus stibiiarsenatis]|uniref:DUF2931 family protein n=1 Tax=Desulfuribacillus stibiiarsenatis TaxID=1390249 RepID=A0A1E5L8V3_9FIRM|nr:hypothetical protein [Desulfuribacillus stibiiarsenatis]OEH86587.1 hypothetical protein BHU72_10015 [Desulfuribacillus stibiiarsenatis]
MKQNKIWIQTSIAAFLIITVGVYYYYFSGPTDFLNDDQAIEALNRYYFNPKAMEIQDVVFLDEKHVLVPFITENGYATSCWTWKNRSWRIEGIDTSQLPFLWKTNPKAPSSYALIWNISPDNDIATIDFYLIGRRGYYVSDSVHRYTPRIQLHTTVLYEKEEKSYAVVPIPNEWIAFLDSYEKVEKSKQPRRHFYNFMQPYSLEYAWIPYNESGEVTFPKFAQGMASGGANIVHLSNLNVQDLEYPIDKK